MKHNEYDYYRNQMVEPDPYLGQDVPQVIEPVDTRSSAWVAVVIIFAIVVITIGLMVIRP